MKRVWSFVARVWVHIATRDNALHTILGAAIAGWEILFLWQAPLLLPAFNATMYLYLREVGQVQGSYYRHNFLRGWTLYWIYGADSPEYNFWRAFHRHMEWLVPSIVIWAANLISIRLIAIQITIGH